jgi:hypothetical protein
MILLYRLAAGVKKPVGAGFLRRNRLATGAVKKALVSFTSRPANTTTINSESIKTFISEDYTASVLIIKALGAYAVCSLNKSNVWLAPAVTRVLPLPFTGRSEP